MINDYLKSHNYQKLIDNFLTLTLTHNDDCYQVQSNETISFIVNDIFETCFNYQLY
jgi:hypothetical protein